MIVLQKHRLQRLPIILSTIEMPCAQSTNEDTKQRLLNHESNINESMLWVFLFSYIFLNERKKLNTPQNSFFMLEVNKDNSTIIVESSSIIRFKVCTIPTFSFNLELIVVMALLGIVK
jgi:hypothetical protein